MDKKTIECPLCRIGGYPHFSYSGSGACDHCGAVWTYDEGDTLTDDSLRRLWEKVPRWIPVGERLPDDETELLVAFEDRSLGVAFAVFHHLDENDGPKWTDGNGVELKEPTHWMPLPDPPEVK